MTGLILGLWLASVSVVPVIDVVYPRVAPGDSIPRLEKVDSNFVFGSVQPPSSSLTVNGYPVKVESNGAFLGFLPVDWKRQTYNFVAVSEGDTARQTVIFATRPESASTPMTPPAGTFPLTVELSGVGRNDPRGTYYIFPTAGTRAQATGWAQGYYQIPITGGRSVWFENRNVREVSRQGDIPYPVISKVIVDTSGGRIEIRLPVERQRLFRAVDEREPDRIVVEIYGVVAKIDRISYRPMTGYVREVLWDVPLDNTLRLDIRLDGACWGYRVRSESGAFVITVKQPPVHKRGIRGLKVAIDAGHGGEQDGAIGPSRIKEKDANLATALALAKRLEKAGAEVIVIRSEDVMVGLNERTTKAVEGNADIFVSLHLNALPDGVNPFEGIYGSSVHYSRSQSRDLADAIQGELLREFKLPDEGVYYSDFAVTRGSAMPAVLIEAAHIILPDQEMLILNPEWGERLATAVHKGIEQFIDGRFKPKRF